jgi:hypothetical protein
VKRISWRLQVRAEGDRSERARRRAAELANDADLRLSPPIDKPAAAPEVRSAREMPPQQTDDRVAPPGKVINRAYKGESLQVQVLQHGFEFEGAVYQSLSAVARTITHRPATHREGADSYRRQSIPIGLRRAERGCPVSPDSTAASLSLPGPCHPAPVPPAAPAVNNDPRPMREEKDVRRMSCGAPFSVER